MFHSYLSTRGYCSSNKPKLRRRIRKNGKIFYHYNINSYTFSSFNWIHDIFYIQKEEGNFVKIIPQDIDLYLNQQALAVWFMDDGSKLKKGAKIATNCFTKKELSRLCEILKNKFNLKSKKKIKFEHSLLARKENTNIKKYESFFIIIFNRNFRIYIKPKKYYFNDYSYWNNVTSCYFTSFNF